MLLLKFIDAIVAAILVSLNYLIISSGLIEITLFNIAILTLINIFTYEVIKDVMEAWIVERFNDNGK